MRPSNGILLLLAAVKLVALGADGEEGAVTRSSSSADTGDGDYGNTCRDPISGVSSGTLRWNSRAQEIVHAAFDANQFPEAACGEAKLLLTLMPRDGLFSCVHQFEQLLLVGLHFGRMVVPLSVDDYHVKEEFEIQSHNLAHYFDGISRCQWVPDPSSPKFTRDKPGTLIDSRLSAESNRARETFTFQSAHEDEYEPKLILNMMNANQTVDHTFHTVRNRNETHYAKLLKNAVADKLNERRVLVADPNIPKNCALANYMASTLPDHLWEKLFLENAIWLERRPKDDLQGMLLGRSKSGDALAVSRDMSGMRSFFVSAMVGSWLLRSPSAEIEQLTQDFATYIASRANSTAGAGADTVLPIADTIVGRLPQHVDKHLLRGKVQDFNRKHGVGNDFSTLLNEELQKRVKRESEANHALEVWPKPPRQHAKVAIHIREGDKKGEDPYFMLHNKYRDYKSYVEVLHSVLMKMNRLHYEAPFGLCIQMSDANMSAQSAPSTQTCMHTIRESELMSSVGLRNDDLQKGSRRIPRDRKTQYFQEFFAVFMVVIRNVDFVVATFSSNVGRALVELLGASHCVAQIARSGPLAVSLDDPWFTNLSPWFYHDNCGEKCDKFVLKCFGVRC